MTSSNQYPVYTGSKNKKGERRGEYSFAKKLLGLSSDKPAVILRSRDEGLPFKSVEKLQEILSVSDRSMARLLEINNKTFSRRRQNGRLDPLESDRLLRVGRLVGMTIDVIERDHAEAIKWLMEPNDLLGEKRPMDVINTEVGARQVEDILGSIEWGHTA